MFNYSDSLLFIRNEKQYQEYYGKIATNLMQSEKEKKRNAK